MNALRNHILGLWGVSVALAFGLTTASAQDVAKDEAALTRDAKQIDAGVGATDATRAVERLTSEFSIVRVKTSAADAGRLLTAADVQALRARGLGYGEIAIVLSLYAHQRGTTFRTLDEIVALKRPGQGWGQVAKIMGFDSLGAVKHDLKRTAKAMDERSRSITKAEKVGNAQRGEKPEKIEKIAKPQRIEKSERPAKAAR